ncbi:acVLRF1 family peptidyl-tRNA hydrolase [Pseudarthrobacter sp. J75]|uniref:acVLRF1 family peptidyl-tRNA hydrolase n=1 Tax=unclassified Pseudarthrobacter TaxID=2647000 RepID=UPI002E801690|nr:MULTISPECIES: acVLRF1 family peptidyl-tRNA hydrolase [unclassified Pseudarthrobacter]MEE2523386.1 acVLRF1 family peptidyl-tRNA hydrolase [Pseudarthrobacter sp. J47]MEE2529351.1 acVLRF1 family peptidyl-tRNA hydrolase [Pseudarthrobacter sp. J75]
MDQPASRTAFVAGHRLAGWTERFAASHGPLTEVPDDGGLLLRAADGATALLRAPWPADGRPGTGADPLERLASLASQERSFGLILVRRGGYAVGAGRAGRLLASKTGSRYVQSRTAAGGQSQSRFARRRGNQTEALAESAAEQAAKIFAAHPVEYLVPGGDKALVDQVLAQPVLKGVASRARLDFLDVPDPKATVLAKAATDACSVRILVTDPPS